MKLPLSPVSLVIALAGMTYSLTTSGSSKKILISLSGDVTVNHCQFEKFPQALEQFNIDIKREPTVWDYCFDRTQLYTVTKLYDKALADANVMVSLKPDNDRHALRANCYDKFGKTELAAKDRKRRDAGLD
jgi:hypothetical protein